MLNNELCRVDSLTMGRMASSLVMEAGLTWAIPIADSAGNDQTQSCNNSQPVRASLMYFTTYPKMKNQHGAFRHSSCSGTRS